MTRERSRRWATLCSLAPLACGSPLDGSVATAQTDAAAETATLEMSSTGESARPPQVQVVAVTADQGVRVPLVVGGAFVGANGRNAPLVARRPTLIRAFYVAAAGFGAQEETATLVVEQRDGSSSQHVQAVTVSEGSCRADALPDCEYGDLTRGLQWMLSPEHVAPGARFRVELTDASLENVVFPRDGSTMPFGIEDSAMKLRVVLVPLHHDLGPSCPQPPALLAPIDDRGRSLVAAFAEQLRAVNPVEEVEIIAHEPVAFHGSMTGTDPLVALQELRFAENAPPWHHYYGIARPCDEGPPFAAVAFLAGPSKADAAYRVGWGVLYSGSARMFVHEIGHQLGRLHVACKGNEPALEPDYPDEDGHTLSWGTDVFSRPPSISPPSARDFMSYCKNTWVSEWGWNRVYGRIADLTRWERDLPSVGATEQTLLVGTIGSDGRQSFFTTRGRWSDEGASGQLVARRSDGGRLTVPARIVPVDHAASVGVIAALPEPLEHFTALAVIEEGRRIAVDVKRIRPDGS